MISHRRFISICLSLVAWFWSTANAFAQPLPTSSQPKDATRSTIVDVSNRIDWNGIRWVERRYKIEALRFKAIDETGIDFLGSDEVMIETRDVKGATVSKKIEDVDSGKTHSFDPAKSCIFAVRPGLAVLDETSVCEDGGEPAPVGFYVAFWEKDPVGYPSGFCIPGTPGPGRHGIPYCANDGDGDEFIGSSQIDYPTQDLEAALPNVGDELIESITLDSCPGEICTATSDYTFTWRVTRLPNVRVNLGVGRYLRGLSARKSKPGTANLPQK